MIRERDLSESMRKAFTYSLEEEPFYLISKHVILKICIICSPSMNHVRVLYLIPDDGYLKDIHEMYHEHRNY